jgi:hypothetical protein
MTGRVSVSFDATDVGSGLYRVLTEIDGRREPSDWLDARTATPCRDRDDDESDPYEFRLDVPCPPAIAGAQGTLWTHRTGDGLHDVSVFVEDASGNATRVLGPVRVRIDNPEPDPGPVPAAAPEAVPEEPLPAAPPLAPVATRTPTPTPPPLPAVADPLANGYRATPDAQLTAHARRVGHGRPAVVSGSLLVPGGRKIIGARIEVQDPVRASRAIVVTDRLGRFVHRAPAGPSRTLRLTYRATPTAAPRRVAVSLRVRARVRSSRRGGRVRGARAGVTRGS